MPSDKVKLVRSFSIDFNILFCFVTAAFDHDFGAIDESNNELYIVYKNLL